MGDFYPTFQPVVSSQLHQSNDMIFSPQFTPSMSPQHHRPALPAHLDAQLFEAIQNWNLRDVSRLLQAGANVNGLDRWSNTPLHQAAHRGAEKTVLLLLQYGANPSAKGQHGNSPLHMAAFNGHVGTVAILIQARANVNAIGRFGNTALHQACFRGHEETVLALIKAGANVGAENCFRNESTPGATPMVLACQAGHVNIINLLERHGGNKGGAFLHLCDHGEMAGAILMLKEGAKISEVTDDGNSALHLACRCMKADLIFELINRNASVCLCNAQGHIPLQLFLAELIKANNNNPPSSLPPIFIQLFIETLSEAAAIGHSPIVSAILAMRCSASINTSSRNYVSPLAAGLRSNSPEIVRLLLEAGASPKVVNPATGNTLLEDAIGKVCPEVMEMLVSCNDRIV